MLEMKFQQQIELDALLMELHGSDRKGGDQLRKAKEEI